MERAEVRELYAKKGFRGPLLERVVDTICANRDVWVAVMMAEEHGLEPIDGRARLRRQDGRAGVAISVTRVVDPVSPGYLDDHAGIANCSSMHGLHLENA